MLKKPPPPEPTSVHLGIRIDEDLKRRLQKLARDADITVSEAVKQFLIAAVVREEAQAKR